MTSSRLTAPGDLRLAAAELATALAEIDGVAWAPDPPDERHWRAVVRSADRVPLGVVLREDRVEVDSYEIHVRGPASESPRTSAALARGWTAIAKQVARRLLPEARRRAALGREQVAQEERSTEIRERATAELRRAAGATEGRSDGIYEIWSTTERAADGPQRIFISLQAKWNGRTVDLEVRGIPLDLSTRLIGDISAFAERTGATRR